MPFTTLLRSVLLAVALIGVPAPPALASGSQVAILEDDGHVINDPVGTLQKVRELGATVVRMSVRWQLIAPSPNSRRRPAGFNASNPAAYPARNWAVWDQMVTVAHYDGITLDLDLMGGEPAWAMGPGRPPGNTNPNWNPSSSEYAAFVRAVGTRYSGNYNPVLKRLVPGDPGDLPKVNFWSIWNEPDYGPSLPPQGVPGNLTVENSPRMYRNLVNAAWSALQATGHRGDTIVFGEIAPRGESYWGVFSGMEPLTFLRALYCVDSHYRQLRGRAAAIRGCPTNASGSRRFRAQNPGLFQASGFADHAYMRWYPPNQEVNPDPVNHLSTSQYASLGVIGQLTRTLDHLQLIYGSAKQFPIYDTEFAYITSPPKRRTTKDRNPWVSPTTAAYYLNWAEYLHWRNPRIRSFSQYLLWDPEPATAFYDWGGFASGLLGYGRGVPKPSYYAWRLPLYLPVTSAGRGRALEVWGCVRPGQFSMLDTSQTQTADIQFAPGSSGNFTTVQTVTLSNPGNCYFDVHVRLPGSGAVRLAYTYPASDALLPAGYTIFSRTVQVQLH